MRPLLLLAVVGEVPLLQGATHHVVPAEPAAEVGEAAAVGAEGAGTPVGGDGPLADGAGREGEFAAHPQSPFPARFPDRDFDGASDFASDFPSDFPSDFDSALESDFDTGFGSSSLIPVFFL